MRRRDAMSLPSPKFCILMGLVLKCGSDYNMKFFNSTASDGALESPQQLSSFQ